MRQEAAKDLDSKPLWIDSNMSRGLGARDGEVRIRGEGRGGWDRGHAHQPGRNKPCRSPRSGESFPRGPRKAPHVCD